jgi:hypothetical protein
LEENKRIIASCGIGIVVVAFCLTGLASMTTYTPEDPTYTITVWIEPSNYTFHLHIDFFLQASDTGDNNKRYGGYVIKVEPYDGPQNELQNTRLPSNLETVWVDVYVDEMVKRTSSLDIGQKKTITIPDHIVEMLIVPWTSS